MSKRFFNKITGVTKLKRKVAKFTGIPTTKSGRNAKLGNFGAIFFFFFVIAFLLYILS